MALGKLKWVENLDPALGTDDHYWFLKAQADYSGDAEEYWLVTREERETFRSRAQKNPEDEIPGRRGVFSVVTNTERKFAREASSYTGVEVDTPDGERERWLLSDFDLERIRQRVQRRESTVQENASSWLADLLD